MKPLHDDLVGAVYYLLVSYSTTTHANRFMRKFMDECEHTYNTNGDMVALNHFWRIELGLLRRDTIGARECLSLENTEQSWVQNFATYVLPIVIAEDLPKPNTVR